jgi:hypothetical protein
MIYPTSLLLTSSFITYAIFALCQLFYLIALSLVLFGAGVSVNHWELT